jgi:Flp pilus assembly pilin Flp
MERIKQFMRDESGVVAVEYIVLVAIVGSALVIAVGVMTGAFNTFFTSVSTWLGTQSFGS